VRGFGKYAIWVYSAMALVFLMVPIIYTIVFSFNDSRRTNIVWRGFTLDNWLNVCSAQGVCQAFGNSILIGVVATVLATTLGTMIAIALVRYRFRFRSATTLLLFLPMATPEVVLGAGLAAQFLQAGVGKGIGTIILAHTMFCISFVVVTVRARVASPIRLSRRRVAISTPPRARCSGASRSRCCCPASPRPRCCRSR